MLTFGWGIISDHMACLFPQNAIRVYIAYWGSKDTGTYSMPRISIAPQPDDPSICESPCSRYCVHSSIGNLPVVTGISCSIVWSGNINKCLCSCVRPLCVALKVTMQRVERRNVGKSGLRKIYSDFPYHIPIGNVIDVVRRLEAVKIMREMAISNWTDL